jgi:hypothetical protein
MTGRMSGPDVLIASSIRYGGQFPAPGPAPVLARGRPAPRMLIAAPCGIDDYFHQINIASTDDQRHRIGERYGIPVGPR